MAENFIPEDLLIMLRKVDTPTVCNAIEVVQGKGGSTTLPVDRCNIPNQGIWPLWGSRVLRKSLD
jgi:hypothetical protein